MTIDAVCTSLLTIGVTTAGTAVGYTVPEHPGRTITQFNGVSFVNNTEFAQYAATYDEYRVEAIILEFAPYSASPVGANTLVVLSDYDNELSAGVLTSTQLAARYSTALLATPGREFQYIYKPPARRSFPEWATTANTGSTSARGCLYVYVGGTASGAQLGTATVKHFVRFRNSNG